MHDSGDPVAPDSAFVPGTATGSIVRNDEVRVEMVGGASVVDSRAAFTLRFASATVGCDYERWNETMHPPWTRVSCPAEGGVASIQHAETEGWVEIEGYNLATCTVEHFVENGRVTGRLVLVDQEDGSSRGDVNFDVPVCD